MADHTDNSFTILGLHPIIVRNLELMGYEVPRPIQAQVIGPMLAGRDVIGLAQTGTGKTAAFAAPIAHHLISSKPSQRKGRPIDPATRLRALVLCPTRELAQQVADESSAIVQGSVLRAVVAYGKVAIAPQANAIARGVDLLIATPGRLRELLDDDRINLSHVRHVTIDEADRMLDMGFLPQVTQILENVPTEGRQIALFTATMPHEIEELARNFLRDPVRIEIGKHTTPVEHVRQHLLPVHDRDKVAMLLHLIEEGKRRGVLVFCRTKRRTGWVGTALQHQGVAAGMLHGDLSQAQRKRAFDRFANGELAVLVATDVAARGLHVPAVKTVVNYDLPLSPEEYVHRMGRAAHGGGGFGEAFTFLSEDDRQYWRGILRTVGVEVYAEQLEGFIPKVNMTRGRRKPMRVRTKAPKVEKDDDLDKRRTRTGKPRRSRKGRPIKKGQKPGKGVIERTRP